jgi:hypothetical protein
MKCTALLSRIRWRTPEFLTGIFNGAKTTNKNE